MTGLASEYDDDGTFTVLRARDRAHRLTQGRRLAVWQGTTLGQVVSDLAGQAELKVGQVTASAAKYPRAGPAERHRLAVPAVTGRVARRGGHR